MFTVHVALLSPPYATLSYTVPPYFPAHIWVRGLRVVIPLGNSIRVGVIVAVNHQTTPPPAPITIPKQDDTSAAPNTLLTEGKTVTLKSVVWCLEHSPVLHEEYLELANQLALRQTTTIGRILGNLIPQGLRTSQMRIRFFGEGKPVEYKLKVLSELPISTLTTLSNYWINKQAEVVRTGQNKLDTEVCFLQSDPPWPVKPAAKKQIAVLEYLLEHGAVSRRKLQDVFGKTYSATLSTLIERNLIVIRPLETNCITVNSSTDPLAGAELPDTSQEDTSQEPTGIGAAMTKQLVIPQEHLLPQYFTLTSHQLEAYKPLQNALATNAPSTHLLFGITGSGKTAIYLELARECLNNGRSVLLLAPEVALAYKLWGDVTQALQKATRFLFHGYLSPTAKEATFYATANQQFPCIVIGTRSALFLPLKNIGLIVMDEEHDSSFKQDEGFTYQAKEVAWFKAGQENSLLLLGSATPDIKSFYAVEQGNLPVVSLNTRAGQGTLPSIKLIHLAKGKAKTGLLAEESMAALTETVNKGEQAVILLNRRGYAPILYCLQCNTVAKCPHCDIGLAYHKGREKLLCHYCGYSVSFPSPCPHCQSMQYLPMGEGTEKIEEYLSTMLPSGTGILRLDKDTTRRPGQIEAILDSFARKEASVLIGTQMLSKGHHFPDVTLAIVADADLGLNLPDYRAAERTFQLLVQSAGRAGRGHKPGTVLVQTRDPSHYCWQYIQNADYLGFYAQEVALRQKRKYPPFVRLALIRLSYPMQDVHAMDSVTAFGSSLREVAKQHNVQALGPVPSPLPFLQGRRRYQCLLKGQNWQEIRQVFSQCAHLFNKSPLRITLDLDPVNML